MSTDNARKTVGDYVTLQRGTTYSGSQVGKPGPVLLGLGSIVPGGGFRTDHFKTFGGECPEKLMLGPGDIYVALKGATKDGSMVGSVARVPRDIHSGRLTQDTARLDFISKDSDLINHIYWTLRTPQYRRYCEGRVTGSASSSFSREDFLSYLIPPVTSATRAIVATLEALEAKIELLQRMNETLAAMAQTLFRSWFVDFDPVRAKSEGRKPYGMDAETAALFPDKFQQTELGLIPRNWKVQSLGDCMELKRGYDLPSQERELGTVPIVSSSGPSGFHSRAMVKGPGVVTGRYGTIGQVFYVEEDFWPLNTTLYIKDYKDHYPRFLWYILNTVEFDNYSDKAAVPGVNRNHLHMAKVIGPPLEVEQKFVFAIEPYWELHAANTRELLILAAIRDILLPKLLTGELSFKEEAEEMVEAAS